MEGHIRRKPDRSPSRRPSVEALEDRTLLSSSGLLESFPGESPAAHGRAVGLLRKIDLLEVAAAGGHSSWVREVLRGDPAPADAAGSPAPDGLAHGAAAEDAFFQAYLTLRRDPPEGGDAAPGRQLFVIGSDGAGTDPIRAEALAERFERLAAALKWTGVAGVVLPRLEEDRRARAADQPGRAAPAGQLTAPVASSPDLPRPSTTPAPWRDGEGAAPARGAPAGDVPAEPTPAAPGDGAAGVGVPELALPGSALGQAAVGLSGAAAALLEGGLPFDLPALRQEVDEFFARLGDLAGAGQSSWACARLGPWLVIVSAAAIELARRWEKKSSRRAAPGGGPVFGPAVPFTDGV
jgi:hypothetical protein